MTYASWGIDYLKYDLCSFREIIKSADSPEAANKMMVDAYIKMRDALHKTGRPIVYSFFSTAMTRSGVGALQPARTCGELPATSTTPI